MVVGAGGISMLVLSPEAEVLALEAIHITDKSIDNQHFGEELQGVLSDHKLLKLPFRTIHAAVATPQATLVPARLFSAQECAKYFKLLQPAKQDTFFGYEEIKQFACYLVWGAGPAYRYFGNRYQPRHVAGALIHQYQALAIQNGYSIFLNIRGNEAQITIFDGKNLVFYNTFEFNRPVDLLYFVLLVYDQFNLNPEQVPLQASGALLEDSECYKMLYKYLQQIQFVTPTMASNLPKTEKALPAHYWFDLLSL